MEWHRNYIVDPATGCWVWQGPLNSSGYGRFLSDGKKVYAHRAMWEFAHGRPIPKGMLVCHRCDRPRCVNPYHLFLGTARDNIQDMWQKGRGSKPPLSTRKGEKVPAHKLTEADVTAIRLSDEPQRVLAERYGVRPANISRIKTGVRWAHSAGPLKEKWKRAPRAGNYGDLSDEACAEIRAATENPRILSERYGVSRSTIRRILGKIV